jgi:hypothetical protein
MLAARWNAQALNAPASSLFRRPSTSALTARAYLITDEAVSDTAARHAATRPDLDPISPRPDLTPCHRSPAAPGGDRAIGDQHAPRLARRCGFRPRPRLGHCRCTLASTRRGADRWCWRPRPYAGQRHEPSHFVPAPGLALAHRAGHPGPPWPLDSPYAPRTGHRPGPPMNVSPVVSATADSPRPPAHGPDGASGAPLGRPPLAYWTCPGASRTPMPMTCVFVPREIRAKCIVTGQDAVAGVRGGI